MEKTSALSKYLQTSGLGFINSFNMEVATINDIKQICRDFRMVIIQTDYFVIHANKILDNHGCNIIIESISSPKRICKNKNDVLDVNLIYLLKVRETLI